MFQFLQQVDQFGIQQKLQVPPINPTQKSAVGGLVTLALYSVSLAYFINQIVDWQNNNKLPKYFSVKKLIDEHKKVQCADVFAEITNYQLLDKSYIDPFDPENLILLPVIQYIPTNWSEIKQVSTEFVQVIQEDGSKINKFLIKNITFIGEPLISDDNQQIDYQINFQWCNRSDQIEEKFKCANESIVNRFFSEYNQIQISILLDQYNFKNKKLQKTPQVYFFDIIKDVLQYQEFYLKVNSLNIDDGFLFSNFNKLDYFTNLSLKQMQFDMNFSIKTYEAELLAVLYFQVDQLMEESTTEYPKISEILAETGSIISFIMQISYLVQKYNEYLCMQKTKKEIISMYYKDYAQFKIEKNWKGQIVQIKKASYNFRQKNIIDFFTNLEKVALSKINYMNLQYEVSRLQIFVAQLLNFDQMKCYKQKVNSIGQFLQDKISAESRNYQANRSQIIPEFDLSKSIRKENDIDIEDLESNFIKTMGLLVLDLDYNQDVNVSNSEIQVINIDNSLCQ